MEGYGLWSQCYQRLLILCKYMTDFIILGGDDLFQTIQLFEDLLGSPLPWFRSMINPSVFEPHNATGEYLLIMCVNVVLMDLDIAKMYDFSLLSFSFINGGPLMKPQRVQTLKKFQCAIGKYSALEKGTPIR